MTGTGLVLPGQTVAAPRPVSSGTMTFQSVASMQEDAKRVADAALAEQQGQPVIGALAGHIKGFFAQAVQAKEEVQRQMLEALYARRGEYTSEKRAQIIEAGQPLIYMMVGSVKMRQAESLIRDVVIGAGTDKPWTLRPTPAADLPPEEVQAIRESLTQEVETALMMGLTPTPEDIRQRMETAKAQLEERLRESARIKCERMETKMEDQLLEGGFAQALDEFITDLTTYKTAFIAGPIVRKKPKLTWGPGYQPVVTEQLVLEWERVDPFDVYPAPNARSLYHRMPLVRKHQLTREDLNEMIGVEGYSTEAITKVLELYGTGGLADWTTSVDNQRALAEGKTSFTTQVAGQIDALQFWGSASGQMLRDWGMTAEQAPEVTKEYQIEAWLIGTYVIKAVLNDDPLARRGIYGDSYERVPGSVWGNSVYDLMHDCQDMCNAAARSLAANLGISSGPQVGVNVQRMPPGTDITSMYPWKIWQFESDPMGSTAAPLMFFQPDSHATELMGVYEKFSQLADEYTGVPKYTVGAESAGGAGRTASGMSMMLGNASKLIKQVVSGVDQHVLRPLLERLYYYNMRYSEDPDLKGDVSIVARGAMSMSMKEAAQVRRNEFLGVTNNPVDLQIMGLEGRAEVLRSAARMLDLNTDKVVPPAAVVKERAAQAAMQQQQAALQQGASEAPGVAAPTGGTPAAPPPGNGQTLMNGAPQTDNFQPTQGA